MDQILQNIAAGAIGPGDRLPPVRQLADELKVNFNTVARAYRLLDEAGAISTQHGRGTYLLDADRSDDRGQMRRETLLRLAIRYVTEARRLGFEPASIQETVGELLQELYGSDHPDLA